METDQSEATSKFLALAEIIQSKAKGTRIIVASQWVELLELAKIYLQSTLGIQCASYTLKQSAHEKYKSMERFKQEYGIECLLLSIYAGGAGLNITAAKQMVIMDLA